MDPFKTFRDIYLAESKKVLPLSKLKETVMAEQDLPEFNNFEKEILQYGLDNIESLQPGSYASEVGDEIFNPAGDGIIIYNNEGIEFLTKFNNREGGYGWAAALEYAFDAAEEMGNDEFLAEMIRSGNWAGISNYLIIEMGRRLILASEILAQKIANNDEEMDAEDIKDLEQELDLFIN